MNTVKATAAEIKHAIVNFVEVTGNVLPSEIYPHLENSFPRNNPYEVRFLVKEMQKETILIPDIIFGGLIVNQEVKNKLLPAI